MSVTATAIFPVKSQESRERSVPSMSAYKMKDLLASLVVFLIALPLCLGIALASGAPPALGLISGIIGGIVVGALAGCPLQVSGPAAGLTVLVVQLIDKYGIEKLGWVVLFAGVIQVAAGFFRVGQVFRAISPAVIHGMLAGIGVLILSSQIHLMVDAKPKSSGLLNLLSIPEAVIKGLVPVDGSPHFSAALVGITSILVLMGWNRFAPEKLKSIPGALIAVIAGAVLANWGGFAIRFVEVPDNMLGALNIPDWSGWSSVFKGQFFADALALAFVASAETLLCAAAVDQMHDGKRCDYDRELISQGVGNSLCGVVGALPITGVIVRSAANVNAGAQTRSSAILHGFWLLLFVVVFPKVLEFIPTAALAALLVYTGFKLVNIKEMKNLSRYGFPVLGIYFATLLTIVSIDLLSGIILGVLLSLAKVVKSLTEVDVAVSHNQEKNRTDVALTGAATFIRLPKLADTLATIPAQSEVHVHLEDASYIDHSCIELLAQWERKHRAKGGTVSIEWDLLMQSYTKKPQESKRVEVVGD